MNQEDIKHSGGLIGAMRESGWTMRSIASVVILTFGGLVTLPAAAAVKQEVQKIQWHKTEESHGAKLSARLLDIRHRLRMATQMNLKGASFSDVREQFKDDAAALADLDKQTLTDFASTRAMIQDKHLPDVIMQRELAAEKHYKTEMAALRQGLDAVTNETDDAKAQAKSKDVLDRLSKFQMERSQQKFDPKNLPNRSLKPDLSRKPFTTKKQFAEAGFIGNPRLMVATTAPNFDYSQLPGANNPAYLAATTEVTISPAIQAQAAALNYNPVQIYNWVRNNIVWQPTWGAVQDADLTLSAQRGNAFDISSLLIALLRASNIPARYVLGTINVPADKFRNWVGGFQDVNAAVNYASAGGIPITSLYSGGQITTIQMQHIWVEAAIDYMPSHGAINKSADSWVPMDASYKQYTYKAGVAKTIEASVDPSALATSFLSGAGVDTQGNWVSGLNIPAAQTAFANLSASAQSYVNANISSLTVGDVLGGPIVNSINVNQFAATLPYSGVIIGARYGALPTALEQQFTFGFGSDIEGNPTVSLTFPWAQLNNRKIILSFVPATASDMQALTALLPSGQITDPSQFPLSIPSYLVNVIPQLTLDGDVILTGAPMQMGQEITFTFAPGFAGRSSIPQTYQVIAGSYLDIAAIAGNVAPSYLTAAGNDLLATSNILTGMDPNQLDTLTRDQILGDEYYATMLSYYGEYAALSNAAATSQHGDFYLAAGIGSAGYEPAVDYTFGVPTDIHPGAALMNLPIINVLGIDTEAQQTRVNFALGLGILSSTLEAEIPNQMLTDAGDPQDAISAVTALQSAIQQGQRVYILNSSNATALLPMIHQNSSELSEISNAIAGGKEVIVHTDQISSSGWTGGGYIIFDPITGDGAYKISGGQNGVWKRIQNFLELMTAGATGYVEARIGYLADNFSSNEWFIDPLKKYYTKVAEDNRSLGLLGLLVSFYGIYMDKTLSSSDKLGQVCVDFLSYAASFYLGGVLLSVGLFGGWLILAMVVMSVVIALLTNYINSKFFSVIAMRFKNLEA